MKYLILCLLLIPNHIFSQSVEDTKEFIRVKIESNPALPNYKNYAFFNFNIHKQDAEIIAGRPISETEFPYIFICGSEMFLTEQMTGFFGSRSQIIDLRSVYKVSTNKEHATNDKTYYSISLYFNKGSLAQESTEDYQHHSENKSISNDFMSIDVGNDPDLANKLKLAFIHLCSSYGSTVKDGDLF